MQNAFFDDTPCRHGGTFAGQGQRKNGFGTESLGTFQINAAGGGGKLDYGDAGADLPLLNKIFFRTKSPARLALEGMVCSSLRSYRDHAINIAVITLDMLRRAGVTEDDCSDLASLAGQVRGNRVAITVRELSVDPPRSKVSLRTDGGVDASQGCARFGGGGHKMASGCELDLPPDETADAVRRAVEEVWA